MKKIILSNNSVSLVDDEDYEKYGFLKWSCNKGYVFRTEVIEGRRKTVYLHRLITNAPDDLEVDHINGDPSDNRKSNLRLCTHKQNMWNIKRKGVSYRKERKKWRARINVNNKEIFLGYFETKEQALKAYEDASSYHFGQYKRVT